MAKKEDLSLSTILSKANSADATSCIYYAVKVLDRNKEYTPGTSYLTMKGVASAPTAKQIRLGGKILEDIQRIEQCTIRALPKRKTSMYITKLSTHLQGLYGKATNQDAAEKVLNDMRERNSSLWGGPAKSYTLLASRKSVVSSSKQQVVRARAGVKK